MAYCPKCNAEMNANDVACPQCGYDFPNTQAEAEARQRWEGLAYSPLADIALLVSMIAAVLGCCGAIVFTIIAMLQGQLLSAIVVGPIAFFLQLGMLVVFLRVQNVQRP